MTITIDGVKINLERETLINENYRKVISTTNNQQLVLMSLTPGVEIGEEVHPTTTQFIRVEGGNAVVTLDGTNYKLRDGDAAVIPPGIRHNIRCAKTAEHSLKLYTIYSPPEHPPGTVQLIR